MSRLEPLKLPNSDSVNAIMRSEQIQGAVREAFH